MMCPTCSLLFEVQHQIFRKFWWMPAVQLCTYDLESIVNRGYEAWSGVFGTVPLNNVVFVFGDDCARHGDRQDLQRP